MKKPLPESIYNTPVIEAWLTEQARQGLWFDRFCGYQAIFYEGEPGECRYRLEPRMGRPEPPDEETLALYGDAGWEYAAAGHKELYLWRAARPDARELYNDPISQGMAYDGLARILKRRMWIIGLIDLALVGLWLYLLVWYPSGILRIAQNGLSAVPANLFMIFWNSGLLLSDVRTLRKLRRTLGAGIPPERTVPHSRRQVVWIVCGVTAVLMLGLSLCEIWNDGTEFRTLTPGMPLVSIADLGTDAPAELCWGRYWQNLTAASYVQCYQDGEGEQPSALHTEVCRLRLGFLAGRLLEGYGTDILRRSGQEPRPLADPRFDELYFLQSGDTQYLTARLGARVLYMEAQRLPEDLTSHLDNIAAALTRS